MSEGELVPSGTPTCDVAPEHAALRRGHEEGRRAFGPLPLDLDAYSRHALSHARRRIERCGASAGLLGDALDRAHGADLFLAIACEEGVPGAWEVLVARVLPTLAPVAVRRGATAGETRDILSNLPGELCAPPPQGGARTRIGTYDGSGSLFAWLAVVVSRRVTDLRRARYSPTTPPLASLDAAGGDAAPGRHLTDRSPKPIDRLVGDEDADTFRTALRAAWRRLTEREALVLLWKYRDGISQRDMARLLGVGEPRISRIVDGALTRLRDGLSRLEPPTAAGAGRGSAWPRLAEAVGFHLASSVPLHDIVGRDLPAHD